MDALQQPILDQEEQPLPLYSKRAILTATFFGGPLVTGILLRKNLLNLTREKEGNRTLYICIAFTVVLFALLFSLPDQVMRHIPGYLIPAIYTAIAGAAIEKLMGNELKAREGKKEQWYSGWRAFAFTLIGTAILVGGVFAYSFYRIYTNDYDVLLAKFQENENKSLRFYDIYETSSDAAVKRFLQQEAIPLWKENLKIVDQMDDAARGIDESLLKQNQILREYALLRIEFFETYQNALGHFDDAVNQKLNQLGQEMEDKVNELGQH